MKKVFVLFLLAAYTPLFAQTQLAYKWTAGKEYVFKSTCDDEVSMGGGGMMGMMGMMNMGGQAMKMNYKTEATFTLAIDKVLPNGSAEGTFFLTQFSVTDSRGARLASLANIPKRALRAPFSVDDKGNFSFRQIPFLVKRENQSLLVSAQVKPGTMAASSEMDGEKVSLLAEFNPKTGALKAGYTVQTLGKTPNRSEVKPEDETVDLIPTEFLDLLQLPDGPVSAGSTLKIKSYGMEMVEKVKSLEPTLAMIDFNFNSGLDARKFEKDAKAMDPDGDHGEDDHMQESGEMGTPDISQETNGTMQLHFDPTAGMMKRLSGTINSKSNMMGMEVSTKSKLLMVPLSGN